MSFDIAVRRRELAAIVSLSGELDVATAPKLRDAFNQYPDAIPFVVDFEHLTFMDSSGISVLIAINKKTSFLRLASCSERIHELFKITGLTQVLHTYDSVDEALQA